MVSLVITVLPMKIMFHQTSPDAACINAIYKSIAFVFNFQACSSLQIEKS